MNLRDTLAGVRQKAEFTLWKARTVGSVGRPDRDACRAPLARREGPPARSSPRGRHPSLLFRFHARNNPHRIAVIEPAAWPASGRRGEDRATSFFELNELIDRVGARPHRRGVGRGSAPSLMLKNRPEFVILQPAIGRIGGAAVSVSWRSTARRARVPREPLGREGRSSSTPTSPASIREAAAAAPGIPPRELHRGGRRGARASRALDELVAERARRRRDASEDGRGRHVHVGHDRQAQGRGAQASSSDALASALAFIGETPMRVGDVHLAVCPLYHATAFGFIGLSFMLGGTVVVLGEFKPEPFLEAVERYRVTTTARRADDAPPPARARRRSGSARYDTSSLRAIFSGGAPLPAPLAHRGDGRPRRHALQLLRRHRDGHRHARRARPICAPRPGTIGRADPGQRHPPRSTTSGRDVRRGRGRRALRAERAARRRLPRRRRGHARSRCCDGFFSVGDLARRDARGCYHIEGRKRDMIISGGVNVYPAEVEAALDAHPAVAEVAVVGVARSRVGRARPRLRRAAARRARATRRRPQGALPRPPRRAPRCRATSSSSKRCPRNPTGKVLKRELRAHGVESTS